MSLAPAISIITPVWNGLPFLKECVESVLSQDFQDWEMIISDNGSTDGTHAYLETLTDKRIKIFKQEKNLGIFGNLNFLVLKPSAPIFYILCADDYFFPGGLANIVQEWKTRPQSTGLLRFNFSEKRYGTGKHISYHVLPKRMGPSDSSFYFYLFGCIPGNLSNVSVRTDAIRTVGAFNENLPYAGDYEYWVRLGKLMDYELVESQVSYVRRHPGVASKYLNKNGELILQHSQVIAMMFEELKARYPKTLLRFHGSWRYLPMLEIALLRSFKERRPGILALAFRVSKNPCRLPPLLTLAVYILTFGGRLGRHMSLRMLVKQHERLSQIS